MRRRFSLVLVGLASTALLSTGCLNPADLDGHPIEKASSSLDPSDTHLVFGGDWSEQVTGPLVAGYTVQVDYDASRIQKCGGETNGNPAWSITAHVRQGGGPVTTIPVVAPLLPQDSVGALELTATGDLEMWFSKSNVWGCIAYDSDFQKNYHFEVDATEGAPAWMGNEASVISRWTCDGGSPCPGDLHPLADGFLFGTWARQRATIAWLTFQVWEPGHTDWDNPDLWKELDVQIHYRLDPAASFESEYVSFDRRLGNNARYAFNIRSIDPLPGNTVVDPANCPTFPVAVTPDGQYVEAHLEYYFTVNGAELRPASGDVYTGQFQDYVGLYDVCLP
jgi:hypothetical protein